jgi:tRNA G10  N-methylase Trm11
MRYFFILGSNPALSAAELLPLIQGNRYTISEIYKHALVTDSKDKIDLEILMSRMGGMVKTGELEEEDFELSEDLIEEKALKRLVEKASADTRITFGFSVYSLERNKPASRAAAISGKLKKVGMELKRQLKERGVASRMVRPKTGHAISSVSVTKNKMIEEGYEFIILTKGDRMMFGSTTIVQPFEAFSKVDYGRPSRDAVQGMLPPKLARMMINIADFSIRTPLLDPFCGSGTVLTEALQLGYRHVHGSDSNPDAVKGTKENIDWVLKRGSSGMGAAVLNLFESDARKVGEQIEPDSLGGIVTEPYLGPPRTGHERRSQLQKTLHALTELYRECLQVWHPLLKKDAPVVMALPVYIMGLEKHGTTIKDFEELGYRTENLLPSVLLSRMGVKATKNGGLLYGRNVQRVWREIVKLRKK